MLLTSLFIATSLVSAVSGAPTRAMKQTTRNEVVKRMTATHRKRDTPSGIPIPPIAGSYQYIGSRPGFIWPEDSNLILETDYDQSLWTLSSVTIDCANSALAASATYFNLGYNSDTQLYFCRTIRNGPWNPSDMTLGPEPYWQYSAFYEFV